MKQSKQAKQEKRSKRPTGPGFFSIFLVALMVTIEVLTFLALWYLLRLSAPVGMIIGSVMALITVIILRILSPRKPRFIFLKHLLGNLLSLCMTAICLLCCVGSVLMGDTFDAMFDSIPDSIEIPAPKDPTGEAFAVYLSGSDTRGSTLTKSRSDVNIIAVVNPVGQQLLLVNTPRDYYVSNPAANGAKDKLTHCGLYGTGNSGQALSNLYGIPIAYVAQINFKGFETLIDALGGVTVYSDYAFTTTEGGYYIQKGENTLNGAQTLSFARERYHLPGGDNTRGQNQMKVIAALVRQVSPDTLIANYREILNSLEGMFATNMSLSTITKLVTTQIGDLNQWEIFSYSVTGTEGSDYNYSLGATAYVTYPDQQSVQIAAALMQRVLDGDLLTAEDFP